MNLEGIKPPDYFIKPTNKGVLSCKTIKNVWILCFFFTGNGTISVCKSIFEETFKTLKNQASHLELTEVAWCS